MYSRKSRKWQKIIISTCVYNVPRSTKNQFMERKFTFGVAFNAEVCLIILIFFIIFIIAIAKKVLNHLLCKIVTKIKSTTVIIAQPFLNFYQIKISKNCLIRRILVFVRTLNLLYLWFSSFQFRLSRKLKEH